MFGIWINARQRSASEAAKNYPVSSYPDAGDFKQESQFLQLFTAAFSRNHLSRAALIDERQTMMKIFGGLARKLCHVTTDASMNNGSRGGDVIAFVGASVACHGAAL
jgi:hypothetical protein